MHRLPRESHRFVRRIRRGPSGRVRRSTDPRIRELNVDESDTGRLSTITNRGTLAYARPGSAGFKSASRSSLRISQQPVPGAFHHV
jgi:hypothetical protein